MSETPETAPDPVPFDPHLAKLCAAGLRATIGQPLQAPPDRLRLELIARLLDDAADEKLRNTVTLSVCDMPELVNKIRGAVAVILRDAADDEEPRIAARLRECADAVTGAVTLEQRPALGDMSLAMLLDSEPRDQQTIVLAPGQTLRVVWQRPNFTPSIEQLLTGPPALTTESPR